MFAIGDRGRSVLIFAVQSRILIFFLQILFNYMIPDHKADVFNPPPTSSSTTSTSIVSFLFDGLTNRWDAIYFLHIAEHSYTYENTLVFFPLFPLIVKLLTYSLFYPLTFFLSIRNVLQMVSVLINFLFFTFSAFSLYHLGIVVIKNEHLAYKAAQLFCVNPASIFFSAAYSESLFSLLTFTGLLKLHSGNLLLASILFSLSAATRSNGLINIGFILYFYFQMWYKKYLKSEEYSVYMTKYHFKTAIREIMSFLYDIFYLSICILISCILFLSFQLYAYLIFCWINKFHFKNLIGDHIRFYGKERGYFTLGDSSSLSWCKSLVPTSYSSIQNSHWDVGFLKYYQIKQLPNFALAFPMLFISFYLTTTYVKNLFYHCIFLGMTPKCFLKKESKDSKSENLNEEVYTRFMNKECFVYVIHLFALTCFALLFMHIQVVTRFICSSCPVIYWFLAYKSLTSKEMMALELLHEINTNFTSVDNGNVSEPKKKNEELINVTGEDHLRQRHFNKASKNEKNNIQELEEKRRVIAEILMESELIDWDESWFNKFLSAYLHIYIFVGVAAFSNFFPWT